ncbi:MAG: long-chain fatty acid--CoA ligase [Ignavibacteriae bacterium HGW-Ignavibacteriae-3]|nr:MAG: long-chain fatty acid--CoA ligase [Ignavibacteriae bacterium HGW-Ignavibacteriae-3]
MKERTLPNLFEESVNRYGDNILMWENRGTGYEGTTYSAMRKSVHSFAAGLINYGITNGDRIALISEGRNYWVISELGILFTGAINVPVSTKVEELNDLKFRLAHSGSRMVVVSQNNLDKIRKIKNDLPDLEKIILLDKPGKKDEDEIFIEDLMKEGDEFLKNYKREFEARINSVKENDYANICYTSGTTADPKGIILTHRNYTANVEQSSKLLPIPESYVSLLMLPWDHAFAHTAGIYTLMKNGASMASVQQGRTPMETLKNVPKNIKEIRPTFLLSVPALAKNFRKNIEKGIREKGAVVEKMFNAALKTAYEYNGNGYNKGKGKKIFAVPLYKFYDKILFSKIRASFGGRLEFFIGGGALLDIDLQHFFYAIGIPMFQGYGLTEAAPVISANLPLKHKLGSSGAIVTDLEVKICDTEGVELPPGAKGEIVVRGENVMVGYWKNDAATKETLKHGWLYTGDLGYFDSDGFLYVLGRFKSLLISSDGEKYSPEGIEEALTEQSVYIEQVMLYNNQSPYTVALVVPNKEMILHWANENKISHHSSEGQTAILKMLESEVSKFRSGGISAGQFPERWIPSAIAVLGEGFTEQNKFMNSTLKIVRGRITEFYQNRIDFLFTQEGKDICNHQNRTIIGRL